MALCLYPSLDGVYYCKIRGEFIFIRTSRGGILSGDLIIKVTINTFQEIDDPEYLRLNSNLSAPRVYMYIVDISS